MSGWYLEKGPENDVIISSRIRLARNFKNYPFPSRMSAEQAAEILAKTRDAVMGSSSSAAGNFRFVDIERLSSLGKQMLVEKHLISPDFLQPRKSSGVILSKDEKISIMVNEEDHLRIQCLFAGLQLKQAWELANKVDTMLEEKLEFAFSTELGYLTCCPTNVGTGIRASVMLHLPALVMTGYIGRILEACGKLGVAVRGLYGENTDASGNLFQISNQVTLGQNEEEIISGIVNITSQVIEQERNLRTGLYKQGSVRFEDRIYRSYGLFSNARIISTEESMKLLSDVRLGVDMGIIKDIDQSTLNEIMLLIQPACLQDAAGKLAGPDERDVLRAQIIRERFVHCK